MTIDFQRDETFILSDQTNPQEWEGSYTIEKMGTSYMIELIFTDPKIEVTGVYGTRKYDDGSTILSLILTTENEVLSFLDNK